MAPKRPKRKLKNRPREAQEHHKGGPRGAPRGPGGAHEPGEKNNKIKAGCQAPKERSKRPQRKPKKPPRGPQRKTPTDSQYRLKDILERLGCVLGRLGSLGPFLENLFKTKPEPTRPIFFRNLARSQMENDASPTKFSVKSGRHLARMRRGVCILEVKPTRHATHYRTLRVYDYVRPLSSNPGALANHSLCIIHHGFVRHSERRQEPLRWRIHPGKRPPLYQELEEPQVIGKKTCPERRHPRSLELVLRCRLSESMFVETLG